jgi:hypothetical protein
MGMVKRSLILFGSSWTLRPAWWYNQKAIIGTKISCFVLPAIQLGLLRLEAIENNDFAQLVIMNIIGIFLPSSSLICIFR